MTQTLEQPAAADNGGPLATMTWRGAQLVVTHDNGPFAHLLDTGKFTQMYRLAEMFSQSQLVPEIFRNKPNDCFIAIQMAMRLGVDPFMFLQNTYPGPGGKPGMEGKLAIALVNSSGLFKGQIRYELAGTGDDRGCVAWAIDKETGERLNGPRVTIGIAKAEGWYARNKKWQTVPDLMLQYRAGAWFGRLMCPERLMGMQTQEEIQDLVTSEVATVPPPRGTNALVDKLRARNGGVTDPLGEPVQIEHIEDEAQANDVIEQKAQQTRQQAPSQDPAAPGDQQAPAGGVEGEFDDQAQTVVVKGIPIPLTLSDEARRNTSIIDDRINVCRPPEMTAHQARKAFHACDVLPWEKLEAARQDEKYDALLTGTFKWK